MSLSGSSSMYNRILSGRCICRFVRIEGNKRRIRTTFRLRSGSDAAEQPDGWYKHALDHRYQSLSSSSLQEHLVGGGERGPLPTRLRTPPLRSQDLGHREAR